MVTGITLAEVVAVPVEREWVVTIINQETVV